MTTVNEELKLNPRLTKSKSEFVDIMQKLGLTRAKMIGKCLIKSYWLMNGFAAFIIQILVSLCRQRVNVCVNKTRTENLSSLHCKARYSDLEARV